MIRFNGFLQECDDATLIFVCVGGILKQSIDTCLVDLREYPLEIVCPEVIMCQGR